ncbi:MAG: type II secretion system protein N [Acidiferrobacterales bacterium]
MKRHWLSYGLLGIGLYLVFLIVTAPAAWIAWNLVRISHGVVSLNEPQGTLWRGKGDIVIHNASSPPRRLGAARWSINPLWLFAGQVEAHVALSDPGINVDGALRLGYGRLVLSDVSASFPAQLAAAFYGPATLLSPAGQVHINAKEFTLKRGDARGNAIVQWQGASSSLSSVQPLGNYRLSMDGRGETVAIKLETVNGSLSVSGQGQWQTTSGQIQFNGVAKPVAQPAELEPMLKLLGPDRGNGQRILSVNYRLPLFATP